MKIKSIIAAALVALLAVTSAFAQGKSKSLVVYFSRADENYGVGTITEGNTAILAKMIASKTGSDIFEIVPEKAYPKNYRECTNVAKDEQRKNARPAYKGDIDTSGYDTIYIGYPIWWGDMPMVCYTFFEETDLSGKNVYLYASTLGSGFSRTISEIEKLAPKAKVNKNGLNVASSRVADADKEIDSWLSKLGLK